MLTPIAADKLQMLETRLKKVIRQVQDRRKAIHYIRGKLKDTTGVL